jgi:hypothetical protein
MIRECTLFVYLLLNYRAMRIFLISGGLFWRLVLLSGVSTPSIPNNPRDLLVLVEKAPRELSVQGNSLLGFPSLG